LTVEQRAQRNRNFLVICIGCIDSASTSGQATTVSVARAQGKPSGELTISNWPLYVDKQTVPDFERASGIKVKYIEDINSYDEFFGKMQPILAQGNRAGARSWSPRLACEEDVRPGLHPKLDKRALAPALHNLSPSVKAPSTDPHWTFSIP